jgi:hypothetical protein
MTRPGDPDPPEPSEEPRLRAAPNRTSAATEAAGSGIPVPEQSGPTEVRKAPRKDFSTGDQDRSGAGAANGATAAAPPWERVATPEAEGEQTVVMLQVGAPEHFRKTTESKAENRAGTKVEGVAEAKAETKAAGETAGRADERQPGGRVSDDSASFDRGSTTGQTGYGHTVSHSLSNQSGRGAGQDFSAPTVRFGGRVQSDPASAQPSLSPRVRPTRIPRRASLQLRHLEPWSVLKVSLVLSVAGFLAWMVAVGMLYGVLGGMGVWDQLNGTYSDLTSTSVDAQSGGELISAGGVFGVAALVGLVNIVLITAMCTVGAFIYNASADLAGGIEITLSERD